MNKVFVLIFLLLSSCQFGPGGLASSLDLNVVVKLTPYTSKDSVVPSNRRPIIFPNGGRKVCRPYPYRVRDIRSILNLKEEGERAVKREDNLLEELFRGREEPESTVSSASNEPVRLEVGENWLKFGLVIANHNTGKNDEGESRNFFLIIESISYNAFARYQGQDFSHSGSITSGYCDSNAEGGEIPPFLYLVTPGDQVNYKPSSKNPLENLTIYISGFPIVDRSSQPSSSLQQRIQGGGNLQEFYRPRDIKVIPKYEVELTLVGYFINRLGKEPIGFERRFSFYSTSLK